MKASADGRWFEFKEGGMVEPGGSGKMEPGRGGKWETDGAGGT